MGSFVGELGKNIKLDTADDQNIQICDELPESIDSPLDDDINNFQNVGCMCECDNNSEQPEQPEHCEKPKKNVKINIPEKEVKIQNNNIGNNINDNDKHVINVPINDKVNTLNVNIVDEYENKHQIENDKNNKNTKQNVQQSHHNINIDQNIKKNVKSEQRILKSILKNKNERSKIKTDVNNIGNNNGRISIPPQQTIIMTKSLLEKINISKPTIYFLIAMICVGIAIFAIKKFNKSDNMMSGIQRMIKNH